jgi:hypothetical protein
MSKVQEYYEDWCEEWKPAVKGQNHPTSYEGFEAGWMAAIEIMLEKLETSRFNGKVTG